MGVIGTYFLWWGDPEHCVGGEEVIRGDRYLFFVVVGSGAPCGVHGVATVLVILAGIVRMVLDFDRIFQAQLFLFIAFISRSEVKW